MARASFVRSAAAAGLLALLALTAIEGLLRTSPQRIARGADDLTQLHGYVAKLAAFQRAGGDRIAILGDSVALGDTLAKHGVADWKRHNLDAALGARPELAAPAPLIANFAANGLRPLDIERAAADLIDAGARQLVVVVGLRGLSDDFEPVGERFEHGWREGFSLVTPGISGYLAMLWQTRGVADLAVRAALGGAPDRLLTRWREAGRPNGDDDLTVAMLAARRFRSAAVSPERAQTQALERLLAHADSRKVRVALVYATENPDYATQLAPAQRIEAARAGLVALAARFRQSVTFIGPDEEAAPEHFVDFVHPSADGYQRMAARIAPHLAR